MPLALRHIDTLRLRHYAMRHYGITQILAPVTRAIKTYEALRCWLLILARDIERLPHYYIER